MRALVAGLALAGCMTTPEPPVAGAGMCDATNAAGLVGQVRSATLEAHALKLSGATSLRWKPPGAMVTMDYRQDRLNATLDDKDVVTAFDCG